MISSCLIGELNVGFLCSKLSQSAFGKLIFGFWEAKSLGSKQCPPDTKPIFLSFRGLCKSREREGVANILLEEENLNLSLLDFRLINSDIVCLDRDYEVDMSTNWYCLYYLCSMCIWMHKPFTCVVSLQWLEVGIRLSSQYWMDSDRKQEGKIKCNIIYTAISAQACREILILSWPRS